MKTCLSFWICVGVKRGILPLFFIQNAEAPFVGAPAGAALRIFNLPLYHKFLDLSIGILTKNIFSRKCILVQLAYCFSACLVVQCRQVKREERRTASKKIFKKNLKNLLTNGFKCDILNTEVEREHGTANSDSVKNSSKTSKKFLTNETECAIIKAR